MEINVKVTLEISESSKSFLAGLFSGAASTQAKVVEANEAPAAEATTEEVQEKKKSRAKSTKAAEEPKAEEAAPQEPKVEEPKAEETVPQEPKEPANNLSMAHLRDAVAAKSATHIEEIKAKLRELGTVVLPKLDESKWQEFYDFVNAL